MKCNVVCVMVDVNEDMYVCENVCDVWIVCNVFVIDIRCLCIMSACICVCLYVCVCVCV